MSTESVENASGPTVLDVGLSGDVPGWTAGDSLSLLGYSSSLSNSDRTLKVSYPARYTYFDYVLLQMFVLAIGSKNR